MFLQMKRDMNLLLCDGIYAIDAVYTKAQLKLMFVSFLKQPLPGQKKKLCPVNMPLFCVGKQ